MDSLNKFFTKLFVHKHCYRFFQYLYAISLKGMGYLNYQDMVVSGEKYALSYIDHINNPVIFDVGAANNDDFVKLILADHPQAEIHAFEPNPASFAQLKMHRQNKRVHLYQFGLGPRNTTLKLYDYESESSTQHASLYKENISQIHHQKTIARTIAIRTLDRFVAQTKLAKEIDFLKIDTEGSELGVLQGASHLLKTNKIKLIQFEFNAMNVYSRVFLHDFISLLINYKLYKLLPDGLIPIEPYTPWLEEIFSFHNILAIRKDLP